MRRLAPGERASFPVEAAKPWNHSGLELVAGRRYRLEVVAVEDWRDASLPADPERGVLEVPWLIGNPIARLGLRVRKINYFVLVGCIDEDERLAFPIGAGRTIAAPATGELTAFANDWRIAYGNNRGRLTLAVEALG